MGKYCKAYLSSQFERFPGWRVKSAVVRQDGTDAEEPYFFLQENLVVTDGIFIDEQVVFDQVTPEWERFCREDLQFEVPSFEAVQPVERAAAD